MAVPSSFVVEIQGNIGAGKSTVLKIIEKRLGDRARVHYENIEAWQPLLEKMYSNPTEYINLFQFKVLEHYFDAGETIVEDNAHIHFVERGPDAVQNVFIPASERFKTMDSLDAKAFYMILNTVFRDAKLPWANSHIVYLRVKPDTCLRRIRTRSRDGESGISEDYLRVLHSLHERTYAASLDSREVPYRSADTILDIGDDETPDQIADRILAIFGL